MEVGSLDYRPLTSQCDCMGYIPWHLVMMQERALIILALLVRTKLWKYFRFPKSAIWDFTLRLTLFFRPFSRWRLYGLPHREINIVGLIPHCGINRASAGFLRDVGFLREIGSKRTPFWSSHFIVSPRTSEETQKSYLRHVTSHLPLSDPAVDAWRPILSFNGI